MDSRYKGWGLQKRILNNAKTVCLTKAVEWGGGWVVGNNEFGLHMPIFFTRVVNINNSAHHPLLPYSFGQASILFWKCATSWKIAKSNFYNSQLVRTGITNSGVLILLAIYLFIQLQTRIPRKMRFRINGETRKEANMDESAGTHQYHWGWL